MADYSAQTQGVGLNFTQVQAYRPQVTNAQPVQVDYTAAAAALGQLTGLATNAYGRRQARLAGEAIGTSGEGYEEAETAVTDAEQGLLFQKQQREAETGGPLTEAQALDLKDEVFSSTLTSQRRIERALKRGLISSSEANARLGVLRSRALANPLVAPFAQELDDSMYRVTGGAGGVVKDGQRTYFGPTAEEQEASAIREGQMKALEAEQKQVTELVRTGIAKSDTQARNLLAQEHDMTTELKRLEVKKSTLGWSSEEAFAASEMRVTALASSGYAQINNWIKQGAPAEQLQSMQGNLQIMSEQLKDAIRRDAYSADGRLIVNSSTLRAQMDSVDKMLSSFNDMLSDQSGTQRLINILDERQAIMDSRNQSVQMDLMSQLHILFALKDVPGGSEWYLDKTTGFQDLSVQFQESSNPVLRALGGIQKKYADAALAQGLDAFINGNPLADTPAPAGGAGAPTSPEASTGILQRAALALGLKSGGGGSVVRKAIENNPAAAFDNLAELPLSSEDIRFSSTFTSLLTTGRPEEVEGVKAALEGSAYRTVSQEMINRGRRRETAEEAVARGTSRRQWSVPSFELPERVAISKKPHLGPGMAIGYNIDTGSVKVSDEFKKDIVNTWELGTANPTLWQDSFESVDAWISSMYARPVRD